MNDAQKKEVVQLIEACKKNDPKAQSRLFELFFSSMFNVCMRYANNSEDAQDMLNDGFFKVFSNINKYADSGSFEAWMKRVMVNTAIDYTRRYKTNVYMVEYDSADDDALNFFHEREIIDKISGKEIMNLIQKLPPTSRTVFNMYIFEGFSHAEISEKLNIKLGTSHWHLNFAKTKLKDEIIKLNG